MSNSARTIFCRFCGASGAHKHGRDSCRRERYKCLHCRRTFTRRTNTAKSGSRLSDGDWSTAARLFGFRAGASGRDIARFFGWNEKTGQRMNRIFRSLVAPLQPHMLTGASEWDEAVPLRSQWVGGGVARGGPCLLTPIPDRTERTLSTLVNRYSDPEGMVFTDEHGGYCGVVNRWSVCHAREFVNSSARFVHTNTIEGVWGHLKPLGWHIYRGFPRSHLRQYLAEFMFRYNVRCYETRISVLSALISRKSHKLLV